MAQEIYDELMSALEQVRRMVRLLGTNRLSGGPSNLEFLYIRRSFYVQEPQRSSDPSQTL